jgi:hypothetical protein
MKLKATFEIEQCWIFAVLWGPFWKWRPVEFFRCRDSIQDVEIEQICLTLKNFFRSPFSKWPSQYRTNSNLFDFNVLNWIPTSKKFYRSPFSKWPPQYRKNSTRRPVEIVPCQESIRDIIIYPDIKFWWYRIMLIFCDIMVAILKMATGRNLFSKWLPKHGIKYG